MQKTFDDIQIDKKKLEFNTFQVGLNHKRKPIRLIPALKITSLLSC